MRGLQLYITEWMVLQSGGLHTCLTAVVVMVSCTHHFAIKLTKVVLTLAANVEWVFERSASSPFIDSHALLSVLQE